MSFCRSITSVALTVCFGTALCIAQEPVKPEDQVKQVERDWLAADGKGDSASLRRIISDDFIGNNGQGSTLGKDDIIPEDGHAGGFAGATADETVARIFGDTGVLMGTVKTTGTKAIRVVLVCQKRPQGWQIVAAQLTPVQ